MLKIVSLAPSNTEILFALGCQAETIAVTKLCDFPAGVAAKEKIGTWTGTDTAKIAALEPDIILTSYYFPKELHNYNGRGEIYHFQAKTLTDVFTSIIELGELVGKQTEAQALTDYMKTEFEKISVCSKNHEERPSVYAEEWSKPFMAGGNWVPEIISLAGGRTKFVEPGQPSKKVSDQQILVFNPEIIVAHWCGRANRSDVGSIKERKNWNHMRAVRAENVYRIDDSLLNRPGPRLVSGAQAVHAIIHYAMAKKKDTENRTAAAADAATVKDGATPTMETVKTL